MNLNKIPVDNKVLQNAILLNATQYYAYKNGEKQDYIEGSRFTIVAPMLEFEKINIKVKNIFVEDSDFKINKPIEFKNLKLSLLQDFTNPRNITVRGEAEGYVQ